jgi:asparagine synthase (glutamine-hydrolysing)
MAREHVTVILSGDGGDELFAGYTSYRGALFGQRYRAMLPYWLGRGLLPTLVQSGAALLPGHYRYAAQRVAKVLRDSALPLAESLRDKISIWTRQEVQQLLNPDLLRRSPFVGEQFLPDPLWKILRAPRDIVSRLSEIDIRSYMLDDILVKVDRMSMAHSLEVRSPLLDHNLLEFVARLPTDYKIQHGQGKALLRKVLSRYLPPPSLSKPKQGFSVPLRDWFREGFAEMLGDYLLGGSSRLPEAYFNRAKVESVLDEHRRGAADHGRKIWLLLVFAAWQDQYQQGGTPQCVASLES